MNLPQEFSISVRSHQPSLRRGGIYLIKHISSNRCYVGSSENLRARLTAHRNHLRRGSHHSPILQNAYRKYGEDSFMFCVVEFVDDAGLLCEREQHWINTISPQFNVAPVAGGLRGYKRTEENKRKQSIAMKGREFPQKMREHLSKLYTGRRLSEETKRRMSLARKGKKKSQEWRKLMSENLSGRKVTPERYAQMLQIIRSPEVRKKLVEEQARRRKAKQDLLAIGSESSSSSSIGGSKSQGQSAPILPSAIVPA